MDDWYKVGVKRGNVNRIYFNNINVSDRFEGISISDQDSDHGYRNIGFINLKKNGKSMYGIDHTSISDSCFHLPEDRISPTVAETGSFTTGLNGSSTCLYVVFSEPVLKKTAELTGNYFINQGIKIKKARLDPHFRQILLKTSPMDYHSEYTLTAKNIEDLAFNKIDSTLIKTFTIKPSWKASEAYATFQGKFGWYYEQFNPTDIKIYHNQNKIRNPQYWLLNYYLKPDGQMWIGHEAGVKIGSDFQQSGQIYQSVRTWMAPINGEVMIEGIVSNQYNRDEEIRVSILQNVGGTNTPDDMILWDRQVAYGESIPHNVRTKVKTDDVIRFVVDINKVSGNSYAEWNPTIRFVSGIGN
ncbi:hypothetical protein ACFLSA_04750 [Bacteroidota bacterium]